MGDRRQGTWAPEHLGGSLSQLCHYSSDPSGKSLLLFETQVSFHQMRGLVERLLRLSNSERKRAGKVFLLSSTSKKPSPNSKLKG